MAKAKRWKCEVCGYVHEGDGPPETCPICGVGAELFTEYEEPAPVLVPPTVTRWRCTICGEQFDADGPPDPCPVCGADASQFVPAVAESAPTSSDRGHERIVIIGGGVAGLNAAESARQHAEDAAVTLVHKEPQPPYNRLNLTRLLADEVSVSQLPLRDSAWYAEKRIDLVHGDVIRVDRTARVVELRDGSMLGFDRLVLANGAHPFVPPLAGASRDGVVSLRTQAHALHILDRVRPGSHCVCIGGGLLGLETAGALARRGAKVTVLEGFAWLLPRQLTKRAGALLQRHIEQLGVTVRCEARVAEILGDEEVRAVRLDGGPDLPADLVVLATGVRPNSHLALQCGLMVNRGVIVDDRMCTSDPEIYAAGDVCEHRGVVYGLWASALSQGRVAGANCGGGRATFEGMPPATQLKVLNVAVFSIGKFQPSDGAYEIYERDGEDTHARLVCRDGVIVGANLLGHTDLAPRIRQAVEKATQIAELGDLLAHFPKRVEPTI